MNPYFVKSKRPSSSSSTNATADYKEGIKKSRIEVELSENDIVSDPGLRKPINSYPVGVRDELRSLYLVKGPCQPREYDRKDAAFCLVCYLFSKGHKHGGDAFTEVGFRNWKKALKKFKEHEGTITSVHHYAKIQCSSFRENVDYVLQKSKEMEIDYRVQLTTIVDVARFLFQQDLAFGGHYESEESMQQGNFLALLKWCCERNEEANKVMDLNLLEHNWLTSLEIQKVVINACATKVRKVIVNEIGEKFFCLLIDKAWDDSIQEQITMVLRFVNNKGEVIERFLGVVHVSDTSSHSLKNAIDDFFAKNGLSLSKVRGQGYNRASNMRGEFDDLTTLILNENKCAHHVHCFAHQHQLVVATSKEHPLVCNFFYHLITIVNIVGVPCKRRDAIGQKHHDDLVRQIER